MGNVTHSYSYNPYNYQKGSSSTNQLANRTFKIKHESYTLIKKLGQGGFGSVWSAVSDSGKTAAIKTIDISSAREQGGNPSHLIESFDKEIKMAYKMRQETKHVVTIYGFDFDPRSGLALVAMELGGDSLAKVIEKLHIQKSLRQKNGFYDGSSTNNRSDYIPAVERKNIWVQLTKILMTLNHHHVIHRDLKPDNLIFFGSVMKIVDLGIAQKEVLGSSGNTAAMGTPYFSAPECFTEGAIINSKADIWSAGAILYQMTYGIPPLKESARPPPGHPTTRSRYVYDVIYHCLQHSLRDRGDHRWLAKHPLTTNPSAL